MTFEKYRRATEIEPTDTAAHHSWYYTMLEFAKKLKGKEMAAYLKQAAAVSAEQKRRRRNLERRILRSERAKQGEADAERLAVELQPSRRRLFSLVADLGVYGIDRSSPWAAVRPRLTTSAANRRSM
ncbi:hypothetical protein ACVDG8_000170 [Mesorhizobium sp. ORM8.1]